MENTPNETLTTISLYMGWTCACMWVIGMTFVMYEPFKVKSSTGISKDYALVNSVGYVLMALQDCYGFYYQGSGYNNEVHIPDLILSFYGTIFSFICAIIVCKLPRTSGFT